MNNLIIKLNTQYKDVLKLTEYKGKYQLLAASQSDNGKTYDKWVFPQNKNREPGQKAIPQQIIIGTDIGAAIQNIEQILTYLKEHDNNAPAAQPPIKDDIPF